MVQETIEEPGQRQGVVTRVSLQLGIGSETLRHWVKQAEVDSGQRPGTKTESISASLSSSVRSASCGVPIRS